LRSGSACCWPFYVLSNCGRGLVIWYFACAKKLAGNSIASLVVELGVETKLSKTVDPDEHAMDSLLVYRLRPRGVENNLKVKKVAL